MRCRISFVTSDTDSLVFLKKLSLSSWKRGHGKLLIRAAFPFLLLFAKGGVIEALDEAKKAGKVRYVGFTGHKRPAIHLKMLSYDYPFDSVQMPLNPFDATYHSFETSVLPEVSRRGMAALGMKSLGGNGQPVLKGVVAVEERYATP